MQKLSATVYPIMESWSLVKALHFPVFHRFLSIIGGLQFLLVWLVYLVLWSIPVIITEYTVGRYTRHAPVRSFRALLGPWSLWCGGWIVAVSVLIA